MCKMGIVNTRVIPATGRQRYDHKLVKLYLKIKLVMVVCSCNPSYWELEVEGSRYESGSLTLAKHETLYKTN
jgi:hypothetical protein